MNPFSSLLSLLVKPEINRQVTLAVKALDDMRDRLVSHSTYPRDRHGYDRDEVLQDALDAWRVNPIARRIVELTSQYVVGGGISLECSHERTNKFLKAWWNHRLNKMPVRIFEWCDELTRSGELFILLSTDPAGMTYMRAVPAADVQEIQTAANDLEQETYILEKPSFEAAGSTQGRVWPVYNPDADAPDEAGIFPPVMLHYAVNRPVGALHGESDLAPLLRWLGRYAAWLEDRARLNRYRNTFIFWVKARFANGAERLARQAELNANPPNPGSILVSDESEEWSVLAPNLASFEAAEDGLALKKMVAVGSGTPLHFLAEPESETRTTAESAGGPTYRHYQQRQYYFLWMLKDLAQVVVARRSAVDPRLSARAEISIQGADISGRDNTALSIAATTIVGAFKDLRDRRLIDDAELLRMAYQFAGEVVDIEAMLKRGAEAPPPVLPAAPAAPGAPAGRPAGIKIDADTGEPKFPKELEIES